MNLVLFSRKWMLSLLSRKHSHRLLTSLFKCFSISVNVYVKKQGKSHQRIVIDLKAQLVLYDSCISEKAKGQELILEAHHTTFSRCLNTYFIWLLRMPD